jgi:hypothetical protein
MGNVVDRALYEHAQSLGIERRSEMTDDQLKAAIEERERHITACEDLGPHPRFPTMSWVKDHLLSLLLATLFLVSLLAQWFFQYRAEVHQAMQHGDSAPGLWSSDFLDAFLASVFENWQSEFLQIVTFIVLATYFIHRGSPQSRDGDDEVKADLKAIRKKLGA